MLGPGTVSPKGRTILVMPLTKKIALADNFLTALQRRGARIVKCDFDEHDRLIATVLTLPHFLNVAFVEALRSLKVNLDLLSKVAGPTFRLQLLLAEELHQESAENEASVLMDNNDSVAILRKYARTSNKMLNTIARGKRPVVRRKLLEGRRFLISEKQFSTAYTRFNQAVSASSFE
jgi:prephenate dehydrogenase